VTRSQQVKILCSTSLAAFTVVGRSLVPHTSVSVLTKVGFTQAFGVFQAHYDRSEAARAGIVRPDELTTRALISAIGSLGNGGIVAVFAVIYYPHLPRIGMHVKTLCAIGTGCVVIGFATAAASRSVSRKDLGVGEMTDMMLDLASVRQPGHFSRHRDRYPALRPCANPSGILPKTFWACSRDNVHR